MIALIFAAALASPPAVPLNTDKAEIRREVTRRHGADTRVDRVIIHGNFALASGQSGPAEVRDGLQFSRSAWHVVCSFGSAVPTQSQLTHECRFPATVAFELAANERAQSAVERGDFQTAVIAQTRAFASAKGPDRDQERARLQLLNQLNNQMRTGMITRAQAIQQWNQFRYSWMLP